MHIESIIRQWHDECWPAKAENTFQVTSKLGEEAGEVSGAYIKYMEGRKTLDDVRDEIGDVLVVLSTLADTLLPGENLMQIREDRFRHVRERMAKKTPTMAMNEDEAIRLEAAQKFWATPEDQPEGVSEPDYMIDDEDPRKGLFGR